MYDWNVLEQFTELTEKHIQSLSLDDRKKAGQYMTPYSLGVVMAEMLSFEAGVSYKILDPAVGTGELLRALTSVSADKHALFGWDFDERMLKVCSANVAGVSVERRSLFDELPEELVGSFDKIIGNPPYFQVSKSSALLKNLQMETLSGSGRINMYGLFFEYALRLLRDGGELVFLVPPSMNNGAYFDVLRKHILSEGYIKELRIFRESDLFEGAITSAQIVHIVKTSHGYSKNKELSSRYVFDFNEVNSDSGLPVIFTENSVRLSEMWEDRKSLKDSGFHVSTGKIEWNKNRDRFTSEGVPLIYSKDIDSSNMLKFSEKLNDRRFLETSAVCETDPSIVVNRIVGALSNPVLRYALVSLSEYYVENHVNLVSVSDESLSYAEKQSRLEKLVNALSSEEFNLSEYLKLLTGNTQLSSRELKYMLPVSI